MVNGLDRIAANAQTPDQLLPYVKAVSGLESSICGEGVLHRSEDQGVLIVYPQNYSRDLLDNAVAEALKTPNLRQITVIAPDAPAQAPQSAQKNHDYYWQLQLPLSPPKGKQANMLRRAGREANVSLESGEKAWTEEHGDLTKEFCKRKGDKLDAGAIYLFEQLGKYIANVPDAALFSCRHKIANKLLGFAIGDFTAFGTAFYMFAVRSTDAPPGVADLLLASLAAEAENRGHSRINLGLGIDPGVEFFKKKWGATKFLPCVETSWQIAPPVKKGWFARLFG